MAESVDLPRPLPDGGKGHASSGDIRTARYLGPTDRYAHAVLGDAIEAAALEVRLADGSVETFIFPRNEVFEDITPRIADLDGDGLNEVITIVASQSGGGSLGVFGVVDGALARRANSPDIGVPNRWMNPAGIADLDGDGVSDLIVPDAPRRALCFVRLTEAGIVEIERASLAAPVRGNLTLERHGVQAVAVVPLASGQREIVPISTN